MLPSHKNDQLGKKSDVVIGRADDHLGLGEPIDRLLDYLAARRAEGEVFTEESYMFPVKDAGGNLHGLTYHQLTEGMNHVCRRTVSIRRYTKAIVGELGWLPLWR